VDLLFPVLKTGWPRQCRRSPIGPWDKTRRFDILTAIKGNDSSPRLNLNRHWSLNGVDASQGRTTEVVLPFLHVHLKFPSAPRRLINKQNFVFVCLQHGLYTSGLRFFSSRCTRSGFQRSVAYISLQYEVGVSTIGTITQSRPKGRGFRPIFLGNLPHQPSIL